ncbi:MAG: hypothetical protein ACXVJW_04010 [Acidimicrobiia bacterium]
MAGSLDNEIAYFNAHVDALRAQADREGKRVVLIFDRRPRGFFDSVVEAATAGYEQFGDAQFLARRVDTNELHPAIASIF